MARTSTRSPDRGQHVADWIEKCCPLVEGEWAGSRFELADWQRDEVIRPLFGSVTPDGLRTYRTALIGIPRKNGKTTLGAAMALRLLIGDAEPGAQVFSAAADKDQARLCFSIAQKMVESSPILSKICKVQRNVIVVPKLGATYKALSAEAFSKHGLSPHGVIFDELHAQPNRELWDVLTSGQGARRQPLTVAITTAGFDRQSICYELYEYGRQIRAGLVDDPTFFFRWWGIEDEDDWTDEASWAKANPNFPTVPKREFLQGEFTQAKQLPARQNAFRNLYLNQWVQSVSRWIDLGLWDLNAGIVNEADLHGRTCYSGWDLASTSDFTANILVFPPVGEGEKTRILCRFFLPEAALEVRSRMRSTLETWRSHGFLTVTEGDVVDDSVIKAQMRADATNFRVKCSGFDPFDARSLMQYAQDDLGLEVEKVPQHFGRLSSPSKELERLLGDHAIEHGGHPILRWMADNVVIRTDGDGRIRPDKKKSSEKIDGIAALVNALAVLMASVPEDGSLAAFFAAITKTCWSCSFMTPMSETKCRRCGADLSLEVTG